MASCTLCEKMADYLIDSIICHGNCRRSFHVDCIDAPYSTIKLFRERKSFYYFCDECDPFAYTNITRDVLQNRHNLEKLHAQLMHLTEKVDKITTSPTIHNTESHNDEIEMTDSQLLNDTSSLKRKIDETDTESFEVNPSTKKPATSASISTSPPSSQPLQTPLPISALSTSSDPITAPLNSPSSIEPIPAHENPSSSTLPNIKSSSFHSTKKPSLVNHLSSPISSGLKVVEGHRTLFISKLDPSTNALDIKNFISNKTGTSPLSKVEKMIHRNHSKYASFKIRVPDSIFHLLNSTSLWPKGIIVHEFENKQNNMKTSSHNPFRETRTMHYHRRSSSNKF